jgi:hypothetical protein
MSKSKRKDGVTVKIVLVETNGGAGSVHNSITYNLGDPCDVALFADDAVRIGADPVNASKLDMFVPGMSEKAK